MPLYLGIDGGGTQTRAVIINEHGQTLGLGGAGPSNHHSVGLETALANILAAEHGAREQAQLKADAKLAAACLGLAGCGSDEDRTKLSPIASKLSVTLPGCVRIESDLFITHAGAFEGGPGIVLIVGTGSCCFGVDSTGKTARAGGWGPMFDDAGSAFDLGRRAITHTLKAADGRHEATVLARRISEKLGGNLRAIAQFTAQGDDRHRIASLAPLVIEAAEARETIACNIIQSATEELAHMVHAVASRLTFTGDGMEVVLCGGLCNAGAVFLPPLDAEIRRLEPHARMAQGKTSAVMGAALLAMMQASRGVFAPP